MKSLRQILTEGIDSYNIPFGLKKGKDFIELETGLPDWYAYIPLHHDASKALASKRTGGVEADWAD